MTSATNSAATSRPFHTYENVGYDVDQFVATSDVVAHTPAPAPVAGATAAAVAGTAASASSSNNNNHNHNSTNINSNNNIIINNNNNNNNNSNNGGNSDNNCGAPVLPAASLPINASVTSNGFVAAPAGSALGSPGVSGGGGGGGGGLATGLAASAVGAGTTTAIAVNKTAIEFPFTEPLASSSAGDASALVSAAKILSTTDSSGNTTTTTTTTTTHHRISAPSSGATTASRLHHASGQSLVTRLITFPPQSPMDSLREWSLSTFKCTKQLINERRGLCPVTSDTQLANEIEQLRENRNKLMQMLRLGQQMVAHYGQLVRTQRQLHSLVNEMSVKCFAATTTATAAAGPGTLNPAPSGGAGQFKGKSKQVVANFSSLSNNLSSSMTTTTTTAQSPERNLHANRNHHHHHHHHHQQQQPHKSGSGGSASSIELFEDFLPVLNHMKTSNDTNLVDDFKRNSITLNVAIRNGEKLIAALNFYCSNLSTLINKTIEDTLDTVKQFELARLEYDAEKNSLNLLSASSQTSVTYSSDKVELARLRYEQLREDVQIKLRFLEENTVKVMHKQLLLFNGAFASYTAGNTAALDSTLKQFSIRE